MVVEAGAMSVCFGSGGDFGSWSELNISNRAKFEGAGARFSWRVESEVSLSAVEILVSEK